MTRDNSPWPLAVAARNGDSLLPGQ